MEKLLMVYTQMANPADLEIPMQIEKPNDKLLLICSYVVLL